MAVRALLGFLLFLLLCNLSAALYEDQVGLADWHQKYIGKVKQAVFHTQKTGRKRVVVSTEENIIASLDLRRGDIFWRHVLGKNDPVDQIDIALGKFVVTLSSEGSTLRAWNLPDGLLIWETVLQVSTLSKPLLYVSANSKMEKSLILVFGGGWLHAISSIDGEVIWKKEFSSEGLEIQRVFQPDDSEIIYAVGFLGSSQFVAYHISAKSGEPLKHSFKSFSSGFSGEASLVSDDMLVALDASRSTIVSIGFQGGVINFHETHISDLVHGFFRKAELLPSKFNGLFALKTDLSIVLVKVRGLSELKMIDKIDHPASVSDAVSLSGQQAFAMVQHVESKIHITVKLDDDLTNEILKETVAVDRQRGQIQIVFINNYFRTDSSHGFRALFVMEDHSLLLVQQGEIVWSREDGLASVIDSTTSELPVEKDGVSVAKVEHSLFEWLQVLALDKRYLDPRRTVNPTQSEKEEGIIPLTDSLPIIPQSYVTHSLQVEGLRGIETFPAKLESTTLVFTYGVDLFFTRIAPSRTYDSLTEDFNYALLLITIIALVVAILVTWALSERKELREKWR